MNTKFEMLKTVKEEVLDPPPELDHTKNWMGFLPDPSQILPPSFMEIGPVVFA